MIKKLSVGEDGWAKKMDGWMVLAAAIVRSGRESGDERFLKSAWCEELKEGVVEWANLRLKDGHGYSVSQSRY